MGYKYAIILGGSPLNIGVVQRFREMGLHVVLVDYRKDVALDADLHFVFDAKDPEVAFALRKHGINHVDVVYTSMDNAGLAQREICKQYGLLCASEEAILAAHHKDLMHKVWADAGILNRKTFAVRDFDIDLIRDFNQKYKTVIKPSNACASRGLTVLEKYSPVNEIEQAFDLAKRQSAQGLVNVEEYIKGTEFTVEMCGDTHGNVGVFGISKKYHSTNAGKNRVAVKLHYNPSDVDMSVIRTIADYGIQCYKALGLKCTLGHLEIILKEDGTLSPIEIGARSSGFIASHLVDAVCGRSFLAELRNVQNAGKVSNGLLRQSNQSSMYFFYDLNAAVKSIKETNIMQFFPKEISSLYFDRGNLLPNKIFADITQDTDRYGYEILVGPKEILTCELVRAGEEMFLKEFMQVVSQ